MILILGGRLLLLIDVLIRQNNKPVHQKNVVLLLEVEAQTECIISHRESNDNSLKSGVKERYCP